MKCIIDGVAYNTATATAVKRAEFPIQDDIWVATVPAQTLYVTRYGAWFLFRQSVDVGGLDFTDDIVPMSDAEAGAWLARWDVDLYERHFGHAPEAGEDEAVIFIRVPRLLRGRIDASVRQSGGSLNAWAMKVFERALEQDTRRS